MTSTLLKSLLSAGRPTFRHFCSASVPAASTGTTANVEASIPTTTPTASDDSALPPAVGDSDSGVEDKIYSKVDIELRAHQPDVLESYNWFATTAAKHLNVSDLKMLPTDYISLMLFFLARTIMPKLRKTELVRQALFFNVLGVIFSNPSRF